MNADKELINNAMDAAEEKLEVAEDSISSVKEKEEDIEPQESSPEVEEEVNKEVEEDLDQEANVEDDSLEETQGSVPEKVSAPAFWTAERKALFNKAPPEVQKAIAEEALLQQQQVSRLANEAHRAKMIGERINSDFTSEEELKAHKAQLGFLGIKDEIDELHRYRAWNRLLKQDPVSYIQGLIREHALTDEDLRGEIASDEESEFINDPRIDEVVNEFRAYKEQQEEEKKQRETQAFLNEVKAFKTGKDSAGEVRERFATLYAPQIEATYESIVAQAQENGINIPFREALSQAYEAVKDHVNKLHGIKPGIRPQSKETIIANAKKAQKAASNASGFPRTDVVTQKARKTFKNDKEMIEAAVKRAEERSSSR